jgi:hypothetical protein
MDLGLVVIGSAIVICNFVIVLLAFSGVMITESFVTDILEMLRRGCVLIRFLGVLSNTSVVVTSSQPMEGVNEASFDFFNVTL